MSRAKRLFVWFLPVLALFAWTLSSADAVLAGITFTGDYAPAPPWTSSTTGYVGTTGSTTMSAGTGTVTVDSGSGLSSGNAYVAYLAGSNGTATVDGVGSTWTANGLWIGKNGNGYLKITNGGAVSNTAAAYIGDNPTTAYGDVTVDGAGSTWTVGTQLWLGGSFGGVGQVTITNAGSVTSGGAVAIGTGTASTALITVDGAGSQLNSGNDLSVGDGSAGTLSIAHGGLVTVAGNTEIGTRPTGVGALDFGTGGGTLTTKGLYIGVLSSLTGTGMVNTRGIVADGLNLIFDGQDLINHGLNQTFNIGGVSVNVDMSDPNNVGDLGAGVSFGGVGTLTIRNGIQVTSVAGMLGDQSMSSGTAYIDGAGSKWTTAGPYGNLVVGNYGYGILNITNGGVVDTTGIGFVGYYSQGAATVDGAGSTWNVASNFLVADVSTGTLTITNGGAVTSGGNTVLCYRNLITGTVTVDGAGSIWTVTGPYLHLGYGNSASSTVNITNGGTITSASGTPIRLGYGLDGSVTVTVSGAGSTLNCGGILDVGDPSGYASSSGVTTLNVINGGIVLADTTKIENDSRFSTINFSGGTLTTRSLYTLATAGLAGSGQVHTHGLVSNLDMTFDATHPTVQTLTINGVPVNLDVSNAGNAGDLGVSYAVGGNNSLTIAGGVTVNSANGYVGYFKSSSTGTANIDGAGSTWALGGNLYIGGTGVGALNFTNGGVVACAGKTIVGVGKGTINFGSGGGTLTTKGLYVSSASGLTGTGTINANGLVSDTNLTLDSAVKTFTLGGVTVNLDLSNSGNVDDLGVGWNTAAVLTINNGAAIKSVNGYLGYSSAGTGTVDGAGSSWSLSGSLTAKTRLNITNGGAVSDASADLSTGGVATVDGAGSIWITSGAIAGAAGKLGSGPALNITNGGTVVCGSVLSGKSTVTFNGGTLKANAAGSAWISGANNVTVNVAAGGATLDTDAYNMGIARPLLHSGTGTDGGITKLGTGTLTLSGANTYNGVTTVKAGVLVLVDASAGWTGAFKPVLGTGGSASVQGGKLVFDYTGGVDPKTTIDGLLNTSRLYAGAGNPPLIDFDNSGTHQVTVQNTLFGDADLNGTVNGADLNAVLSNYNQPGMAWGQGDFDFNGTVNGADLNVVLSNYNQTAGLAAAVPEPSTLLLMATGLAGLLAYVRRKRK